MKLLEVSEFFSPLRGKKCNTKLFFRLKRRSSMLWKSSRGLIKSKNEKLVVGIDASRSRSGGAVAHLKGIFGSGDPGEYGIATVHFWAYDALLFDIPDYAWLEKHRVPSSEKSVAVQLWWQFWSLRREARRCGIDVMFNTDAGSLCSFKPNLTLSQDMLCFEKGEMQRYPIFSAARLRLEVLRVIQTFRFKNSDLVLFLSEHAQKTISKFVKIKNFALVPHGVDNKFYGVGLDEADFELYGTSKINCLYVSHIDLYKHQWHVIEAVGQLRKATGVDVRLTLVGNLSRVSERRFKQALAEFDPSNEFVDLVSGLSNNQIPEQLKNADIFVFASSCENLPITLLEAMAAGLPIASSDRGPMTEVLGEGAVYFNPENPYEIKEAIKLILEDEKKRYLIKAKSLQRSQHFSWHNCSRLTWKSISSLFNQV